jgi:hypothetical protein
LLEQILNALFIPRIGAEGAHVISSRVEFIHQRLRFRGFAPRNADLVAAFRKAARYGCAYGVSGADQKSNST